MTVYHMGTFNVLLVSLFIMAELTTLHFTAGYGLTVHHACDKLNPLILQSYFLSSDYLNLHQSPLLPLILFRVMYIR